MPRRKYRKNKPKDPRKSKNKQNKTKKVINDKILDLMTEPTEDDLKDIAKLRQVLYRDLKVNTDLNENQQFTQLGQKIVALIEYYELHGNPQFFDEIKTKLPILHNKFGRGGLLCSFATGDDVFKLKFDTSINEQYLRLVQCKEQIIANGKFIWFPVDMLNILCPPTTKAFAKRRNTYNIHRSYYWVVRCFVDCESNPNAIVQEFVHPTYLPKLPRFLKSANIINRYSVTKFIKTFPEWNELLTGQYSGKYDQQTMRNPYTFIKCLSEYRCRISLNASTASSKEIVCKCRDELFPKSMIMKFVYNSEDLDDAKKSQMVSNLEFHIYGQQMERILIQKWEDLTERIQRQQKLRESNKSIFSYKSVFENRMCGLMTLQKEISNKICRIGASEIFANCVGSVDYKDYTKKKLQELSTNSIVKSYVEWEAFLLKLVGRKCENCSERESARTGSKVKGIERFRKCSACQMVFYCCIRCQKIHWKKQHRTECKNMTHTKLLLNL